MTQRPTYEEWLKTRVGVNTPLGHGLFGRKTEVGWEMFSLDVPGAVTLLGKRVLVGFVVAFHAADRLASFAQLLDLNVEHGGAELQRKRNGWLLLVLTCGTLYECADALDELHGGGIKGKLGKEPCAAWDALDDMRKRWRKEPILQSFRNGIAHHLGKEEAERGIDTFKTGDEITIFETAGKGTLKEASFPFALDIILRGFETPIEEKAFQEAVKRFMSDAPNLGNLLQEVFSEVFRRHGAKFGKKEDVDKRVPRKKVR